MSLCRSQRSIQRAAEKLTVCELPDSLSLPVSVPFLVDRLPDHRSRFATFHSVQLFREPLGTKAMMR